jgi:lipoprotein-anchoring transpeptidase ErfK/SrfK
MRLWRGLPLLLVWLLALPVLALDSQTRSDVNFVAAVPASPQEKSAGVASEVIADHPEPAVTQVALEDESIYNRAYRRVMGSLQLYSAPGGALVEDMGKGFNFVTAARNENGYSYIGGNRWIPTELLSNNVKVSRFAGVTLPEEPLEFKAGWILQDVRPSASPGEPESSSNSILERYTRVNLYTMVDIEGKHWYQVGQDQWVHQFNIARIAPIERPADMATEKWVSIDLYEQTLVAYEGERAVFSTLISSGLPQWSTPEGLFYVYMRVDRVVMSGAYGQPDFYYLQDVPWNMFFKDDVALHGTYWHDGFGYRHSHGCVNLSLADAKWLYDWSQDETNELTRGGTGGMGVYVYSSGVYE